jgi:glycosyltransferase involved in cell wall biosynthesis
MKKVLIISYYWPPSGGAGVQRWLKFAKYLRAYNWEPVIYTPLNPEAPAIDQSLEADIPEGIEVIKTKITEPYTAYKKFVGRKKEDSIKSGFLSENKTPSLTENIAVWIRGNLFIPDARKYWIKPSVKFLRNYLKDHHIDAMVSTGPPHSMHMIAMGIKQKLIVPWLADFRDPWTNIDFYDKLKLTKLADKKHRRMEAAVLQHADKIVTVSNNWANDFNTLGADKVEVITNGFDPEDFNFTKTDQRNTFSLCHIGSLNKDRNPKVLWEAIADICKENESFRKQLKLTFIGANDHSLKAALEKTGLIDQAEFISYLPHGDVLKEASKASVLLLLLNDTPNVEGIIPGKLFEYLALKRPIICIGSPTGDSSKIIHQTGTGKTIGFKNLDEIKIEMLELFAKFEKGESFSPDQEKINSYSRKMLTGKIANLLNELTEKYNN